MGNVSITELITGEQDVQASQVNNLVLPLLNEFNGSIDNSNVKAGAAIAYTKLSLGGSILNSDINASAAIAYSKLAALTDGNILVGNGSNVAVSVTPSGDVSVANTGAMTVTDLTITNEADGDLLQFDGSNWIRVAKGSAGQVLSSDGTDSSWSDTFGTQSDKSASYGAQQAATAGFVTAHATGDGGAFSFVGYSDSAADPTTILNQVVISSSHIASGDKYGISFPVLRGDYWKIVVSGQSAISVYFNPLGA